MFGGRKQGFLSLSFLNWQRAKVLLKLECDTEDQVLFKQFFRGLYNLFLFMIDN